MTDRAGVSEGRPHDVRGHYPYHEYPHPTDHTHAAPPDLAPLRHALDILEWVSTDIESYQKQGGVAEDLDRWRESLYEARGVLEAMR